MAINGSTLYAGGGFNTLGGQTRNYIAALDTACRLLHRWNPNSGYVVFALALNGNTVYAGRF